MATIRETKTDLTITLDVDEFIRVLAGHFSNELANKLPRYRQRFKQATDGVEIRYQNGSIVIDL